MWEHTALSYHLPREQRGHQGRGKQTMLIFSCWLLGSCSLQDKGDWNLKGSLGASSVPVSPENPIGVQLEGRATLSDLALPGVRLMNIEPDSSCSPHLPQLFHGAAGKGTCSGHSRAVLPREIWLTNHRHDLTSFL